jgi:hypothetical protein
LLFCRPAKTYGMSVERIPDRRQRLTELYAAGMVLARKKGKFFESLSQWIKSNEPAGLPMKTTPDWLKPFVDGQPPRTDAT